jgi:phosphate:Na+ symporter
LATTVLLHLLGGVALLLWGLRMVRTGIMRAFGGDLRRAIGLGLRNRISSFFVGLGVTAAVQSSTATALMTASFAERGLVATAPALAVMLGADVGTALVAQALSFDVTWLSPALILIGVAMFSLITTTRWRDAGRAVVGLGLMLLALRLIVESSRPLQHSQVLHEVMAALAGEPLIALLLGAGLTWLAHSSLAIILMVMSMTSIGLVPLPLALALVLGANLGGGLPAAIATWSGDANARRVTLGNLSFRLIGAVIALPLLTAIAPALSALGGDLGRQVVNFHLGFNAAIALVFLALLTPAVRLAQKLLPERPTGDDPTRPRYLDPAAMESPALAIAAASRETLRMGDALETMLRDVLTVLKTDDRKLADDICRRDNTVDRLHEAIKLYLTKVSREALGETDSKRCMEIIAYTTNLEHVGDIIDKNLVELAVKKMKNRLRFSDEGFAEIGEIHASVLSTLKLSLAVFMQGDPVQARKLLEEKALMRDRERRAAEQHIERLKSGRTESIETSSLHLDILRDLKRIHSHLISVAYPILEQTGELKQSRLVTG